VDLTTSSDHCGACDQACTGGAACVAAACACGSGSNYCSGECTDPKNNPAHCGACNVKCSPGKSCVGGACM
jgi:hypothetical protein